MAPDRIIHRSVTRPAWLIFGLGLLLAGWFGLPLIQVARLENHFFAIFWYSMLGLAALLWMFPVQQSADAQGVERSYCWLGLIPLLRQRYPFSDFRGIRLDQEPALWGRDNVWLQLEGENDRVFVFAHYRASVRQIEQAQMQAQALARLTGLPLLQAKEGATE